MLAALRADHPDIFKFINAKIDEKKLTNFNISVLIPDSVMEAYENDEEVELSNGEKIQASEIITAIAEAAWRSGEPGLLFIDTMNRHNPDPQNGKIVASNPCEHRCTA